MAGGNSMEEATAMIAAANKVVQDPSQVGSGLRTISLRLRGTAVKGELEELGEDTTGLVSSSKMRDKIKGLAGVDILTDTGSYKSTYEIIKEIGHVWEDMSDMDQAALLELMAGKNRSNIMAALITNMEDLEGAYEKAMDAEGSAYRENEAYLDSIQGRVDLFMNALQTFWMNLISSDLAKGVVDTGTWLIKFLDTIPGKATAAALGISALLKVTKGFDAITAGLNMALGTNFKKSKLGTVVDSFKKGTSGIAANTAATQANTGAKTANTTATNANSKADLKQAGASKVAGDAEIKQTAKLQANTLATTEATGATNALTVANTAQAGSSSAATKAFSKLTGVLKAHPFFTIAGAVLIAVAALDKFTTTAQEASEASHDRFNEIADVYSTTQTNISDIESELSEVNSQISELEGKNLSFTDDQELQRLHAQRAALESNLSIQEELLKSQEKVKNEAAVNAMRDFVKSSNEGAESAEKTGKAIGVLTGAALALGVALAVPTGGTSLLATAAAATGANAVALGAATAIGGAVIGGAAGGVAGSRANAATVSTYEDWYKTYTDAYKEKTKAAADAREKYEKDPGDMKKYDKWQKLEQEATDVQSKMYDNLTQMQNYYSGIKYGESKALDKELDAWNNFLDKMNIDQNGAGAKVNALDRIFGENASDEVKAFKEEIDKVIKDKDNKFDIAAEIEGREDLQDLEDQLNEIGITTDEVSDYFRKTGEVGTEAFSDLSAEIAAAETAATHLENALGKETNKGYETRNTGLEEMKSLMEKGAIGSESNLWNIAEAMGFTYDSAKSIEANADALYDFINVRDDWYQVDDNGEWGVASADAFAKDIEKAIQNSKEFQKMDIKWDFDESTGTLDFDFNNMEFDEIVEALGKTKEAAGLTNEEFIDMLTHLGQFYDVQWTSGNDIVSYLEYLSKTSLSAKSQLEQVQEPLEQLLRKQNLNPDQIEDYLTGNGSLKDLPKDLQEAVKAYRELHKEAKKSEGTGSAAESTKTKKSDGITSKVKGVFKKDKLGEEQQDEKSGGLLSALSMLLLLGGGKKKRGAKDPFGPLSKSPLLGGPVGKGAKGGLKGLLGKIGLKGGAGALGKIASKGAIGALAKGAFKIGTKFLGPIGWAVSAATTVLPMLFKTLGKGKGIGNLLGKGKNVLGGLFGKGGAKGLANSLIPKGLFKSAGKGAGLFGALGKGASKLFSKGLPIGLGLGGAAMGIPWLIDKLGGKKKNKEPGVGGNVGKLDVFTKSAKELKSIGDVDAEVTANVSGNVLDKFEFKLDNLKVFAEGAKKLKDVGYVDTEVTANVAGNVIDKFEFKLDNLKTFADSAKGLKNLGYVNTEVTANVKGNVIDKFEFKLDNLKTFADSAKGLDAIGSKSVTIEANAKGNVVGTKAEFKIDNLKVFGESAKELDGITSKTITINADVDGNVVNGKTEGKIDNLKVFGESAKALNGLKNKNITITAEVDGNVVNEKTESKINNLKTFGESAQELNGLENKTIAIKADVDGNVVNEKTEAKINNLKTLGESVRELEGLTNKNITIKAEVDGNVVNEKTDAKINNLKTLGQSVKELEGITNKDISIKAEVDGNVVNEKTEGKINNLKVFGKSAQELNGIKNKDITIKANVEGNVTGSKTEGKIDNLKVFGKSAKELDGVKNKDITIQANVKGNVTETSEDALSNLKTFASSAKKLEGVGSLAPSINANIDGNLTEEKVSVLKKFTSAASSLQSMASVVIKVTASVASKAINNAISLLTKVRDSGLFKTHSAKVAVTADTQQATSAFQSINNITLPKKVVKISETGSKAVLDALTKINNKKLNPKTVRVNYVKGTMPSIPNWPGGRDGNKDTPWPLVNGTAHAKGTAWAGGTAYKGGNWGAPRTETALTGELGPELLIRNGRWTTIGENGAEFTQVQKGDIIFNHRQTEELFKHGYVTSGGGRGKAYADGTAYASGSSTRKTYTFSYDSSSSSVSKSSSTKKASKKKSSDYSSDFEEVFDWFEVRIEEINEDLDLMGAKLENAITLSSKNNILDSLITTSKTQLSTLEKGLTLYNNYAAELLKKVPEKYRDEAKDGKIAIEEFAGKTDEKTLEAIKNYREWAQKAADIAKQIEETKTQIAEYAKQQFDNISDRYSTLIDLQGSKKGHDEDMISYQEERGEPVSEEYYRDLMWRTQGGTKNFNGKDITIKGQLGLLDEERQKLQNKLDDLVKKGVENGGIEKYSDAWYEMVAQIHDVDAQIDECNASIEEYKNAINEIHWNNFEELVNRFDYLNSEVESLIDLLGKIENPVITPERDSGWSADEVIWSDEGLTQLGLYAEKMELAKYQADKYAEEIDYLNKQYKAGAYSETEYLEKLDELKQGQYDSIEAYNEAKDSIVELNEARVDAIKEGIEKEIEAYEELIDKKKEELDAEKDLYDFQKSVMEQQKDIATLERKLAALSSDNSASAMAKRRQLEAELAEAKQGLEETYYDRSLEDQQNALDKELENFENEKNSEIEKLEKYLEDTEAVVADSLALVAKNSGAIYDTLNARAEEYSLTLSDAVTKPWQDGVFEMEAYQERFNSSVTSVVEQVGLIESAWQAVIDKMHVAAEAEVDARRQQNIAIESAEKSEDKSEDKSDGKQSTSLNSGEKVVAKKGVVAYNADGSKMFTVGYDSQYTVDSVDDKTGLVKVTTSDGRIRYFKSDELQTPTNTSDYYKKYTGKSNSIVDALKAVGVHTSLENRARIAKVNGISNYTGTTKQNKQLLDLLKKGKLKRYAKGSLGVNKDQWALINELGEELVLHAGETGKLQFLSKGSGVIPADLTSNLMDWGELNPQDVLDRNRPSIGASPEVHATEINLNIQYGDMLKIENFKGDNPDEIAKIIAKQFEKHTAQLNQSLRKYVR